MRVRRILFTILLIGYLMAPGTLRAEPISGVLDQAATESVFGEPGGGASTWNRFILQTFTVGTRGRLSGLELYAFLEEPGSTMTVEIQSTERGLPTSQPPLVTFYLQPRRYGVGGWQFSADFIGSGVAISPGDVLAIAANSNTFGVWHFQPEYPLDIYPRGTSFIRSSTSEPWSAEGADFFFRTYVDPAPVPEPGTLLLLATGVAVIGRRAWRHRTAAQGNVSATRN